MLYHKDIFIPDNVMAQLPSGRHGLRYSQHAIQACHNDRYGTIPMFDNINLDGCEIIEVEVECGRPVKSVYRTRLDAVRDICIVVLLDNWLVKTVWVNLHSDQHKTLDVGKYATA